MSNEPNVAQINADSKYSSLMAYYIHQNELMWNRLQTVLAVQGAILFAALQDINAVISLMALLLGAFFTFATYIFMTRDRKIRDRVEAQLTDIGGFRLNTPYLPWAKSKYFTTPLFCGFILIDIVGIILVFPKLNMGL